MDKIEEVRLRLLVTGKIRDARYRTDWAFKASEEIAKEICLLIDAEIKRLKEDHSIEFQILGEDFRDRCQQRVERIFREIEANAGTELRGSGLFQVVMTEEEWQALKKQEGIAE